MKKKKNRERKEKKTQRDNERMEGRNEKNLINHRSASFQLNEHIKCRYSVICLLPEEDTYVHVDDLCTNTLTDSSE